MALWEWVADSFGLLLGLAALLVVALFVRLACALTARWHL